MYDRDNTTIIFIGGGGGLLGSYGLMHVIGWLGALACLFFLAVLIWKGVVLLQRVPKPVWRKVWIAACSLGIISVVVTQIIPQKKAPPAQHQAQTAPAPAQSVADAQIDREYAVIQSLGVRPHTH